MKNLLKISAGFILLAAAIASCDKKDTLPATYNTGTAPALSTSSLTSTPVDSSSAVTTISWTSPAYDRFSDANVIYIVQIDSAGKNFSNPQTITTFTGGLSKAIVAKDVNNALLNGKSYPATVPVDMEIRILASKPNYDEQHSSNSVKLHYIPYIPAMPAVAAAPVTTMPVNNELYMVGDMTPGGWNNPVPVPSQKLTKVGNIYSVTLRSNGTGQYLLLPVNGDWGHKYAIQDPATSPALQGYFGYNSGNAYNSNFNGPSRPGLYLYRYDVAKGYYYIVLVGY